MGEDATYNGKTIKIGTNENLYYLRADQIGKVSSEILTPRILPELQFRFPFPDEDKNEPGDFDDNDRGFAVWGYEVPRMVNHNKIQFKATAGILAMLPCPFSDDGIVFSEANKIKYMFNGFSGPVRIVQQRIWEGHWVTVLACGCCGAKFWLPTIDDAKPLIKALEAMVKGERATTGELSAYALTCATIAARVEIGYETPAGV